MRNLSLDIGDVWIGSALSDGAGISCRPYKTVKLDELVAFLKKIFSEEEIETVVVGHPITVSGTASAQTKRTEELFEQLRNTFADEEKKWILWDERFSSQRAASTRQRPRKGGKEEKRKEHSIAAAFILQSYLDSKAL